MRVSKLLLSLIMITFLLGGCGSQGNVDNISSNSDDYDVLNIPRAEITEGRFCIPSCYREGGVSKG